jgi:DNA-binding transcriptional LysR family regulator
MNARPPMLSASVLDACFKLILVDPENSKSHSQFCQRGLQKFSLCIQPMHWDNLRHFLAVARSGSLSGAGRSLRVNPATVSRHIEQLEQELETRLFLREPSGYVLTSAGERLMARAEALEQEVLACGATVANETAVAGLVVVTAAETLASAFVLRHLPALRAAYPALRVELHRTERLLNLSRREADIALRYGRPRQLDLRARRIARLDFGLYASPAWIEQFGLPRESGDLKNCDVIDWGDDRPDYPAIRWFTQATDISRVIFRANSPSDRLTAAREGMGVALGPCLVGDADAGLVRLLPELELVGPEVWLLVHRELADLARVRVVPDVLAQCARTDVGRFAGRTNLP